MTVAVARTLDREGGPLGSTSEKDFRETQFEETANADLLWLFRADALKRAGDIIHPFYEQASGQFMELLRGGAGERASTTDPQSVADEQASLLRKMRLGEVWYLLLGLAIEDLAKGILVSKYGALDSNKRFKHRGHNLSLLVEQCGVDLTQEDRDVLESLKKYVAWKGRYPVSLSSSDFVSSQGADGLHSKHERITTIYSRLERLLLTQFRYRVAAGSDLTTQIAPQVPK